MSHNSPIGNAHDGHAHHQLSQFQSAASSDNRGNVFLPFLGPDSTSLGAFSPASAEGGASATGSYGSEGSFKLFVGCLPYEATEEDLRPLFEKFGEIVELTIQRDRSGFSKGCAWLRYTTREACDDAIAQLHGQYFIGSVRSPIQVKFAAPDTRTAAHLPSGRVMLTGIPLHASDQEMIASLSVFGEVAEYANSITNTRVGMRSSGSAVIRFVRAEGAELLIAAVRAGPINVSGFPCYTLKAAPHSIGMTPANTTATTSSSSRTPPSFVESPQANPSAQTRQPNVLTPSTNIPQEMLNPAKLFIGCLPYSKTSSDLAALFGQYGALLEVALLVNPDGRSKGAAFITFAQLSEAQEAQRRLDSYIFPNSTRPINVSFATNQTWRAPQQTPAAQPSVAASNYPINSGMGSTMNFFSGTPPFSAQVNVPWNSEILQHDNERISLTNSDGGVSPTASNLQHLLAQIIGFDSPSNKPPGFEHS